MHGQCSQNYSLFLTLKSKGCQLGSGHNLTALVYHCLFFHENSNLNVCAPGILVEPLPTVSLASTLTLYQMAHCCCQNIDTTIDSIIYDTTTMAPRKVILRARALLPMAI